MAFSLVQGKCIFAASGTNLKISSMSIPAFEVKTGHCELRETKVGSYLWIVSDGGKRKRSYKFRNDKTFSYTLHNRDRDGQFTVVIKYHDDTTQLMGKLDKTTDFTLLANSLNSLKNESNNDKWLCAVKENIPKDNNCKENNSPSINNSQMTGVIEKSQNSMSSKRPLTDKSSMRSGIGKNTLSLNEDSTPTKSYCERVPLVDKQGPLSKNKTQVRLFPPEKKAEISSNSLTDDDCDVTITALGGTKSSSTFYSGTKRQERPKVRHTYSRKPNIPRSDTKVNTTLSSWSFRERDDQFRLPKDNTTRTPNVVGFSNLGNTCYMNSILQCLLNIPTFFQDLNNIENLELVLHHSLYNSLCNLGILKYSYETLENQRFALQRVKSAISNAATRFSGHAQHDAHELLCQCLDQLKEDLLSETKKKYSAQGLETKIKDLDAGGCSNCPIKSNFESTILHSITCEGCGEKVLKEEVCHDFSLVIPDFDENTNPADQNLEDLLQMYFDREMIEYTCEKCSGSYSVLSHHFSKLPRVLIVHIKRYDMNDLKKTDRICIPKSINLSSHVDSSTKSVPKFVYDKDKLKAKNESECKTTDSVEKRKSPGQLDTEPLQKHSKTVLDYQSDSDINELARDYLVPDLCENNGKENKKNSKKNDANEEEFDDKALANALDENDFTQVKLSRIDDSTNGGSTSATKGNPIEIQSDVDADGSATGIYTSVIDDEDEDLKRALDLSMKEYEQSQRESFANIKQLHSISTGNISEIPDDFETLQDEIVNMDNLYKLVGIVNHHGQNTGTGHYTSDSFDFKSRKWHCYNDSSVKEIKEHEVRFGRSHCAYIVFYMYNQCFQAILDGQ